jgi:hypothetical protein
MSTTPIDDQVREQLSRVIEILQLYARSSGSFHNPTDVRIAIELAQVSLSRVGASARKLP